MTDFVVNWLLEEYDPVRYGDYKLSSGKRSDYYFDSKAITLNPKGSALVTEYFIRKMYGLQEQIEAVGGVAHSAVPIVSQVCLSSHLDVTQFPAFYVTKDEVVGLNEKLSGSTVVLVEDVVTTGQSAIRALHLLKQKYPRLKVPWVFALLDRGEGGSELLESRGYKFWSLLRTRRNELNELEILLNA